MQLCEMKGIGPVRAKNLSAVGIDSLRDLLYAFPVRYEDHETVFPCSTRQEGLIQIRGRVVKPPVLQRFHGLTKVSCQIQDESGILPAQWFNSPWIMKAIRSGETIRLYGRLIVKDGRRYLQNPRILNDTGWIPVYRKIPGMPQKSYRRLVAAALEKIGEIHPENLPEAGPRQTEILFCRPVTVYRSRLSLFRYGICTVL